MSDNMPDFENMSPEEINMWLETLAKRQGASEGLTTTADMDIAEVDPDTAVIDGPGYVPYGQESAAAAKTPTPPPAPPVSSPPAYTPPVPPVSSPPVYAPPTPPIMQPRPAQLPETPARVEPVRPVTPPPVYTPPVSAPAPKAPEPVAEEGGLAWLASLAADQDDELFNLDLSGLSGDVNETPAAPLAASAPVVNPMTWLEDLARAQVAEPSLERLGADEDEEEESEKLNPYAQGVNPIEWLETLAIRQGAKPEELTTNAHVNIPTTDEAEVEEQGYQPFSFDTPPARRAPEPVDTADWLSSLAGGEGYSEEGVLATQPQAEPEPAADDLSLAAIEGAIADGTVTRDQMQYFLEQQADQIAQQPEEDYEFVDEEDDLLQPGELPDWLSDLKPQATTPEPTKPLDALFETPSVPEMPDWLRSDLMDEEAGGLDSIFEVDESSTPFVSEEEEAELVYPIEVDANDPWVEAFDLEYEQGGVSDINAVPEWYEQNLNDPGRIAAVEGQVELETAATISSLDSTPLPPENELPAGQFEDVPAWAFSLDAQAAPPLEIEDEYDDYEEQPVTVADDFDDDAVMDIPDWLKELESVSPQSVPDWLVETITASDEQVVTPEIVEPVAAVYVQPTPPPQVVISPAPQPQAAPTPPPARVASGDSAAVLVRARDLEQSGDLEGALSEYESMVRSSTDLETVVADLTQLAKSYKTTPAVFRVLGDGLMRQGKLQAALNTYREALNQL